MHIIGKINIDMLSKEFDTLVTDEVILTDERRTHILNRHSSDYYLLDEHGSNILSEPDVVLRDIHNSNTIFVIKSFDSVNMNVIVKIAVAGDEKHSKNSIMTAYRVRNKNLIKLIKKHKVLYKAE